MGSTPTPKLPPKSPRMKHTQTHTHTHTHTPHPMVPITEPQQEIIINRHEGNGREVGGIVYHSLGTKVKAEAKGGLNKDRIRINEGLGEGEGRGWDDRGGSRQVEHGREHEHKHGQVQGQVLVKGPGQGYQLSRQPHRDTQETGPVPLPAAVTAQHHVQPTSRHEGLSINPLQHQHQNHHQHQHQDQINTREGGGPRLYVQPPTPENISAPPLQVRTLNTPPAPPAPAPHPHRINTQSQAGQSQMNGSTAAIKGEKEKEAGGEGSGLMSRFKTTFLSKNKGPMSKTWSKRSYLDELKSMAPSSPTSPTSPRNINTNMNMNMNISRSAPVSPADLESGGLGMRRITDQRELPRARSVYASPIALAQFRALPPMNTQGEIMVPPR